MWPIDALTSLWMAVRWIPEPLAASDLARRVDASMRPSMRRTSSRRTAPHQRGQRNCTSESNTRLMVQTCRNTGARIASKSVPTWTPVGMSGIQMCCCRDLDRLIASPEARKRHIVAMCSGSSGVCALSRAIPSFRRLRGGHSGKHSHIDARTMVVPAAGRGPGARDLDRDDESGWHGQASLRRLGRRQDRQRHRSPLGHYCSVFCPSGSEACLWTMFAGSDF